jgi:hypothetical protein
MEELVKARVDLVVLKIQVEQVEQIMAQAFQVLLVIGVSEVLEAMDHYTAVAVAVADTTAVAVEALTKILAAPTQVVVVVDLHTLTHR